MAASEVIGRPYVFDNLTILRSASAVLSCSGDTYNLTMCIGYSLIVTMFLGLVLYALWVTLRVFLCRDRMTSPLHRYTICGLASSAVLLGITIVVLFTVSPSAPIEFGAVAFHFTTLYLFIYARQLDLFQAEPRPNDTRPRNYFIGLLVAMVLILGMATAGTLENLDMDFRCMSLFHIGSIMLDMMALPILLLQAKKSLNVISSRVVCYVDRKNTMLKSLALVTGTVLLSVLSGIAYTITTLARGRHLSSCSAVFFNNAALLMGVLPLYVMSRYCLPALVILACYIIPDIASREERAGLLNMNEGPPSSSHFQFPARLRHLEIPVNEPLLDPSGLASPPPVLSILDGIPEEASEDAMSSNRVSSGTQMSTVDPLQELEEEAMT